jgi:hypothetical protein
MFGRAKILLTIAAFALATPVFAQAPAPATAAYDGTYIGVSREASPYSSGQKATCVANGVPPTLTITNGVARTSGGAEGTVSPDGRLVLRSPNSFRWDGQIDSHGTVKAQGSGTYSCLYTNTWQKQSR